MSQIELPLDGPLGPTQELAALRARLAYGAQPSAGEAERLKQLLRRLHPMNWLAMFQQMAGGA